MEKDEAPTKLSGREGRKQKLMEYLTRKARQKAPDPKSYLRQNSTNSKKLTDTFVKLPTSIKGKENQSDPPGAKPVVASAGGIGRTWLQAAGLSCAVSSTRACTTAPRPWHSPANQLAPRPRHSPANQLAPRPRHSPANQLAPRPHTVRIPTASHPKTASNSITSSISCSARAQSDTRQPVGGPAASGRPVGGPGASGRPVGGLRACHAALATSRPTDAASAPNRTPAVHGSKLSKPDLALGITRLRPLNGRKASPKPAPPRFRQPPGSGPGSRARPTPLVGGRQSGPAKPCSGASALHRVVQQAVAGLDREVCWRVVPPHVDGAANGTLASSRTDRVPVTATPLQGQRKLTAAQEERLQKLQEWRKAKGISYKRPPMPMKPCRKKEVAPPCYWPTMEKEDEVHRLVSSIDSSLTDCMQLLEEGCPTERVIELLSRLPMAHKFAKYWMCRARILEREGNPEVLPLFEEAVRVVLEPVDELRTMIYEILKKKEIQTLEAETGEQTDLQGKAQEASGAVPVTPGATSVLIRGAKEGSSVVKYKITATPGAQQCQQQDPIQVDGRELRFFTPVRRSVRIESSARRYPSALREHDPCVASLKDLLVEELPEGRESLYIYRENEALGDQVQLQFRSPEAL